MKMKTSPWDPVDRLKTEEARAAYREAAQELGDPDLLAAAETDIARAIMKAEPSAKRDLT